LLSPFSLSFVTNFPFITKPLPFITPS
jgi:hypothetical protein